MITANFLASTHKTPLPEIFPSPFLYEHAKITAEARGPCRHELPPLAGHFRCYLVFETRRARVEWIAATATTGRE
jgi:hypothetical protein